MCPPLGDQTQFLPGNVTTPALAGAPAAPLAALNNIQKTIIPSAGPLANIQAQGAPFATIVGTSVEVYVSFSGVTSGSGDVVSITPLIDGAAVPQAPINSTNSGTPGKLFTLTAEFVFTGLVPGAPHQYGYLVQDTSGGTISQSALSGYIQVKEIP